MPGDLEKTLQNLLRPRPEEETALGECLEAALKAHRAVSPEGSDPSVRSPFFLGLLVSTVLSHEGLSRRTKLRACLEIFDAIPLPEREDEAFLTEERVPPGLQEAALFLLREEEFLEYHLLHMIYALYLDPWLAAAASPDVRVENVTTILSEGFPENLILLYAYLLLSSPVLGSDEAQAILSIILEAPGVSLQAKQALCWASIDRTFGITWFGQLAVVEGLFPRGDGSPEEILREVRVRPLPQSLTSAAEEWLLRHGQPGKP